MKSLCLVFAVFLCACSASTSSMRITSLSAPATSAPPNAFPAIQNAPQNNPAWMIDSSALALLMQAGWREQQLENTFDNPQTYVMGKMPEDWNSIPTATFTSYARLEQQFDANAIPSSIQAIVYDSEHWQFTPIQEQQNFAAFVKQAADLVHLHHKILIATPATDLVQALDPAGTGDKYERFLALGVIRVAATYADIVEIQGQGSESDTNKYMQFVIAATAQAKSANQLVIVFAGLSTNPNGQHVTGDQLYAAYQATKSSVDGYWLNIPRQGGYCPNCGPAQPDLAIDFLQKIHQ